MSSGSFSFAIVPALKIGQRSGDWTIPEQCSACQSTTCRVMRQFTVVALSILFPVSTWPWGRLQGWWLATSICVQSATERVWSGGGWLMHAAVGQQPTNIEYQSDSWNMLESSIPRQLIYRIGDNFPVKTVKMLRHFLVSMLFVPCFFQAGKCFQVLLRFPSLPNIKEVALLRPVNRPGTCAAPRRAKYPDCRRCE